MICNKLERCHVEISSGHRICLKPHKCIDFCDNRSTPACSERKKVYSINNPERKYMFLSYHVDGGVISVDATTPVNTKKCDYLFLIHDFTNPSAILVELKGRNTNDAIEQINGTLSLFSDFFNSCHRVYGRIVNTCGVPNMQNTPSYITVNKRLKVLNGNLRTSERIYQDQYEKLDN